MRRDEGISIDILVVSNTNGLFLPMQRTIPHRVGSKHAATDTRPSNAHCSPCPSFSEYLMTSISVVFVSPSRTTFPLRSSHPSQHFQLDLICDCRTANDGRSQMTLMESSSLSSQFGARRPPVDHGIGINSLGTYKRCQHSLTTLIRHTGFGESTSSNLGNTHNDRRENRNNNRRVRGPIIHT